MLPWCLVLLLLVTEGKELQSPSLKEREYSRDESLKSHFQNMLFLVILISPFYSTEEWKNLFLINRMLNKNLFYLKD